MLGTMRWQILLLAALVWLARPSEAVACSCGLESGYPANGDTNVPTDAELAFATAEGVAPVLTTTGGAVVPTRIRTESGMTLASTWFLVAPREELAPETEYVLRASYETRFTTGKGPANPQLAPANVIGFDAAFSDLASCEGGLCGPIGEMTAMTIAYERSADAAYYELVITTSGETWRRLVPLNFFGRLGSYCIDNPSIAPGQEACAELIAVGANGARAAPGEIACITARSCEVVNCDLEAVEECQQPEFVPGPVEPLPPNPGDGGGAWGCNMSRLGTANSALLLLILLLGQRRKSAHLLKQI